MADTHRAQDHLPTSPIWPGGLSKQGPHRVGAFATCPQLEAFAHELHLRHSIEKIAPAIGNLVHVGLAYRYGQLLPQRPAWLVYNSGRDALWICGYNNPEARDEALRVFDAYEAFYQQNTWQPLLVEHQFEVSIEGEPYTARTDLLAVENGEIVLIDHKTVRKITGNIGRSYRADRQMLTGLALARASGWDVKRVVINALSKEQPTPRFARFDVPISHVAYARLGEDTAYTLRQMKETRLRYPDPTNRPRNWDACMRKYGLCDFYSVCTEGNEQLVEYVRRT